jgi:hypothetical protein
MTSSVSFTTIDVAAFGAEIQRRVLQRREAQLR